MADTEATAHATSTSSPTSSSDITSSDHRPDSPSPSVSPSLALDAVPSLDRSASLPSSSAASSFSSHSRHSRLSEGSSSVVRRRGYMRPQGTSFATSAKNRDSVMSLGSIAHMQYYFARTGLLDGKGAQLAKEGMKRKDLQNAADKENQQPFYHQTQDDFNISSLSLHDSGSNTLSVYASSDPGMDTSIMESPTDSIFNTSAWDPRDPIMLPPTVSTYKHKPTYLSPLPDMPVLRRELKEALQDACKVLEESQRALDTQYHNVAESSGYHEIQGLHLLDIITLAIRAAKNYYTAHVNPGRLYAIKPEKTIRSDLYAVLDVLKRMAGRNFRGGMRIGELSDILMWIESIDQLLKQEEALELKEAEEWESWTWRTGDWTEREREREWLFLKSFDAGDPPLPQWPEKSPDEQTSLPSDFLKTLQDGQRLIRLHNTLVSRSKRKFHEIKTHHTDVNKPYRMADNLRYWIKAAELRWDVVLEVPVLDVVHGDSPSAWTAFEKAVLRWCRAVREELTEEWRVEMEDGKRRRERTPPEVRVEGVDNEVNGEETVRRKGLVATEEERRAVEGWKMESAVVEEKKVDEKVEVEV
ncbi:unnamed protein product [Zymoseptoria tritici ST99CH_3D7]|uniref:Calponin-homology (CH) domain-containing protein n=1 Tax=Zymoseptoria tritici (strain ST99CH_3D7) TaxID=1276538 RepID=A0A1X7RWC9_ZYMT9|nr:unnamed protein product [Zymoseptoria tritici ST99CH_3D7]